MLLGACPGSLSLNVPLMFSKGGVAGGVENEALIQREKLMRPDMVISDNRTVAMNSTLFAVRLEVAGLPGGGKDGLRRFDFVM